MKFTRILILFTFLLAFAFQVWAQDEKPKIIWENFQETYKDFADIKPKIKNTFDKPLYFYPEFERDDVLIFNNETNQWIISKYVVSCGNSPYRRLSKFIKLKPNQSLDLSDWLDWDFLLLGPFGGSFRDRNKADSNIISYYKQVKKYKLITFYSEKKNKDVKRLYSSEFWVKPIN